MALAVQFDGTPSTSRRVILTARISGVMGEDNLDPMRLWLGFRASDVPPEKPTDFAASYTWFLFARPQSFSIITMTYPPGSTGLVTFKTVVPSNMFAGLTRGKFVWVGLTATDDPDEEFTALSSSKPVTS